MGRYRGRSRTYSPQRSPTPPPPRRRDYGDRSHRVDRRLLRDRRSPGPTGLLVRNISLSARPEDLREPFEHFGPVKDVYLPKNYYTREPRGFGFVKFRNAEDAAEAKHHLNHTVIGGREIAIVFAAENRKTPQEMRRTGRSSDRYGRSSRRRSPPRSPRRRYHAYSHSPSPARHDSRDRLAGDYYSPSDSRSISHSPAPHDDQAHRSNRISASPKRNGKSPIDKQMHDSDRRSPCFNPRGDDNYSPYDKRDPEFERKSPSAREDDQSLSRPLSQSHYHSHSYSH